MNQRHTLHTRHAPWMATASQLWKKHVARTQRKAGALYVLHTIEQRDRQGRTVPCLQTTTASAQHLLVERSAPDHWLAQHGTAAWELDATTRRRLQRLCHAHELRIRCFTALVSEVGCTIAMLMEPQWNATRRRIARMRAQYWVPAPQYEHLYALRRLCVQAENELRLERAATLLGPVAWATYPTPALMQQLSTNAELRAAASTLLPQLAMLPSDAPAPCLVAQLKPRLAALASAQAACPAAADIADWRAALRSV